MDAYDPATVFSSIDHAGRYAYGNQPRIAQWNLARLAETLLPLLAEDEDQAIAAAKESLVSASRADLFEQPRHPYTRALLAATPGLKKGVRVSAVVRGEPPSPIAVPPSCAYHTRCPHATDVCRQIRPLLRDVQGSQVACHHAEGVM